MAAKKQRLWTIQIRHHLWVFTTLQLVWKMTVVAVCLLGGLTIFYSAYLVYTVNRSNQELAVVAAAENRFFGKNWQESERCKRIILFANSTYTKRVGTSPGWAGGNGLNHEPDPRDIRILREPYPLTAEIERLLGKPDRQIQEPNGACWIWLRTLWKQPQGWPAKDLVEKPWPNLELRFLEARFNTRGELASLMIARKEPDGTDSWENIGRTAGDWKVSR